MSLVTGIGGLRVYLNDGNPAGIPTGITMQAEQTASISKTVGGKLLTITTHPARGGGIYAVVWGADALAQSVDHGSGRCASDLMLTQHDYAVTRAYAPTEHGSSADGSSVTITQSRNLAIGKSAANDELYLETIFAEWFADAPGVSVGSTHEGKTALSEYVNTLRHKIGYLGNDQILYTERTYVVPESEAAQSVVAVLLSPVIFYGPTATFTKIWRVNMTSGALTLVTPGETNSTEPYIATTADGTTLATAVWCPLAQLGAGVFSSVSNGTFTGTSFYERVDYPDGQPPGVYSSPGWWLLGSAAEVVASLLQLKDSEIGP